MPELQLPKPDEVAGALASFPPKLSILVKPLAAPEDVFEGMARQAGFELPPGPGKMLAQFMEALESGVPFFGRQQPKTEAGAGGAPAAGEAEIY